MRRFGLTLSLLGFAMLSFTAWAQTPLSFVPINPCRIFDSRLPNGPFGGPSITGGTTRTFNPQASTTCAIPSTAHGVLVQRHGSSDRQLLGVPDSVASEPQRCPWCRR